MSAHFWSIGDIRRVLNTDMLIYCHGMNFGSFYRNPTILETISIASKWVIMNLIENLFYWNTTMCLC